MDCWNHLLVNLGWFYTTTSYGNAVFIQNSLLLLLLLRFYCAGQRSTPHYRTLEVRPGRIKLELKYDYDCERDDTNSLLAVLMFGWDVVIVNNEWLIKIKFIYVCLSVCLSVCPRLQDVGVLVYGSCMMLVSVRCPLRPGWAWSPTPIGWCVGDWFCGCMAIRLYIMCRWS